MTVEVEPPPARVEYVPPRPATSGAVWVDGEWTQRRGRWAWSLGRWLVTPEGASYSPWIFVRSSSGTLYFAGGVFRDATGKPLPAPPPLAVGKADEIGVTAPDGYTDITGRTLRTSNLGAAPPKALPDGSGRTGDVP